MHDRTLARPVAGVIDTSSLDPTQRVMLGFLARYREPTRSNYLADLKGYLGWCETGHVPVLGISVLDLTLYLDWLRQRGLAESTVARRYGTVAGLLKYAYRQGIIDKNPADFIDPPSVNHAAQTRTRLSPLELADIIRQAKRHRRPVATRDRNLAMILLMAEMGLRVGEVCGLNIEGLIEVEGRPAIKFVGKRAKIATMELPFDVHQALRATVGDRTSGPVFVRLYGPHAGERVGRADVAHVCEALARRASIGRHITPHAFRRGFAKTAHMQGRQLREIQEALRHSDPKTTGLYVGDESTGSVATQAVSAFLASLAS